ncbi:hypothetical protein ACLI4U_19060 (plasmid) [Natrialbaceae archaeon A-CW2]
MTFQNLESRSTTARQRLIEATGTPFAPGPETRPVVAVIDGRRTHDDLEPTDWLRALEATDGSVAVYFYLTADHEWWLAFDGDWHLWTTYPSGAWDHTESDRSVVEFHLEELYWEHDPAPDDRESDIYRSKTVCLEDAPRFVREEVADAQ